MPCERKAWVAPSGDQVSAIICSGRRPRRRCKYCGADSAVLCDAVLLTGPRKGKTCDVPMCAQCTFHPAKETDYCQDHVPALLEEKTNASA